MLALPLAASRLYGTPLLIAKPKLDVILAALEPRLLRGEAVAGPDDADAPRPSGPSAARYTTATTKAGTPVTENGVAVVPVFGSLARRAVGLDALSGMTSYDRVRARAVEALRDPGVKGLILEMDTPGGEAAGVFDLADDLRREADAAGKPLWAVADDIALSAGYAIASAADQIWLTRTGSVGSIGVVAAHVDRSEADRKAGVSYTYIYAGKHKVDGNPHEPLPAAVKADLQAEIDGLYELFVSHVAARRGLSNEAVRGTEARIYRGDNAIRAGLADRVGTLAEAIAAMAAGGDGASAPSARAAARSPTVNAEKEKDLMANENTDTAAEPEGTAAPDNQAPAEDKAEDKGGEKAADKPEDKAEDKGGDKAPGGGKEAAEAAAVASVSRADAAEIAEIAAQAARMGVTVDAAEAIRSGVSPDALRSRVLREAADASDAAPVTSARAVPNTNTPDNASWDAAAQEVFGKQEK